MNWILFIVIGIIAFILISRSMGNPKFWKLVNKNQIKAYDFFMSNDCWYVIHPNENKTKPKQGEWDGPFFVIINGIGRIKIYGREGYKQKQKEFTNLIYHKNIISQTEQVSQKTHQKYYIGQRVTLPDGEEAVVSNPANASGLVEVQRRYSDDLEIFKPEELNQQIVDEVQNEETTVSKTETAQPTQEATKYPQTKDGSIDFNNITDPNMFASALSDEFSSDAPQVLTELIDEATIELAEVNKIKDRAERKRTEIKLKQRLAFYDMVSNIINPINNKVF